MISIPSAFDHYSLVGTRDASCIAECVCAGSSEEAKRLNRLSNLAIGAAIRVHKEIGPGMSESRCEDCLEIELSDLGLVVERQVASPVIYRGQRLNRGYRIDLLVERELVVEVKSVARILKVHEAQVLAYLKHSQLKLGLLINFNVKLLRDGITRIVNGFPE
jgi:GxxExxY protein